ncbi:hypothetical protein KJ359_011306 [Pestalotiopsis sp. 9143b]|nr:hypothetical protein KJ359_011306 [Pestalotiopsis sp. 9143b]
MDILDHQIAKSSTTVNHSRSISKKRNIQSSMMSRAWSQLEKSQQEVSIESTCSNDASSIALWHTNAPNAGWKKDEITSADLHETEEKWKQITDGSQVCIVLASANQTRLCPKCKQIFSATFSMPDEWWLNHCRNSNGYFGAEHDVDQDENTTTKTWAFFETKHLTEASRYQWLKINVFSQWKAATKQTLLVLFDLDTDVMNRLVKALTHVRPDCLADPFWPYTELSGELARLQDEAVWAIRNHVRSIETRDETQRTPKGKPEPEYRRLHDLARHAIHVSESLDVAARTLEALNAQHHDLRSALNIDRRAWTHVRQRLLFHKQLVDSLRYRSVSNEKRLQNEIALAFNTVAQYDSGLSVKIGEAAKIDSAAMKTISLLTLAFLPPTFICAIFSMSFFNYDQSTGWSMSAQFWLYWAFAIPLTLITSVVCYKWQPLMDFLYPPGSRPEEKGTCEIESKDMT